MRAKFAGPTSTYSNCTKDKVYSVARLKGKKHLYMAKPEDFIGDAKVIAAVLDKMNSSGAWSTVWYDMYYFIGDDGIVNGCQQLFWQLEGTEPIAAPALKRTNNCECGAHAVGAPPSLHSTWCPEFAMFKPKEISEVEKCKAQRKVNSVLSGRP